MPKPMTVEQLQEYIGKVVAWNEYQDQRLTHLEKAIQELDRRQVAVLEQIQFALKTIQEMKKDLQKPWQDDDEWWKNGQPPWEDN